jgi:hypothetical protein
VNRQAVLVFPCLKDKLAERIVEYAEGFEITAVSHQLVGALGANVVLVIKGEAESLRVHEDRMSKMMQALGS